MPQAHVRCVLYRKQCQHVHVYYTEPLVHCLWTGNYKISVKRTISLEKEPYIEICKLET